MLKPALLVGLALVATLAFVPTANAGHVGPCWHEYAEATLWFAFDHRSVKQLGWDVGGCVDGTLWWICNGYPFSSCTLS